MKILTVDDDPHILSLIRAIFSQREDIEALEMSTDPLECLRREEPDLVLLDICLGPLSGLDILQNIRQEFETLPVILISAEGDVEQVVKGLNQGANDYLRKPFVVEELLARIEAHLRMVQLQNDLKRLLDLDHVTDLFNMRSMYKKVGAALENLKETSDPVAVVMLDLDHFKKVNDKNDHLFGTYVLTQVGALLKQHLREGDLGARYGGDEFMLFIKGNDHKDLENFVHSFRKILKQQSYLCESTGNQVQITCSAGMAWALAKQHPSPKALVALADACLYEAKGAGRDRCVVRQLT